jgi:predicted phage-related endonuclease
VSESPLVKGLIDALPVHGVVTKYDDRMAWLEGRHARLGGSSLPSLYGYGYKKSLLELWHEKSGNWTPDVKDNGTMRRGRRFEVPILEELADQTGWEVEHWPQSWVVDHPAVAGYGVTPDALCRPTQGNFPYPLNPGEIISVQVKSAGEFAAARWPKNDDGSYLMKPEHEIQCQAEMDCLGVRYSLLVLQPGLDMDDQLQIPQAINQAFISQLHEDIAKFWESIEAGEMPEVDGSEATYDFLRAMYRTPDGSAVELPGDADLWAAEMAMLKAQIKELEEHLQLAKNRLMAAIGESTFARTPGGVAFTYKEQSRATVDSGKLRDKFPEAYEACEKLSFFRVLREVKKLPAEALAMLDV